MTPLAKSHVAWIAGGVAGVALFKTHPVLGGLLSAVVVGTVADKLIATYDPKYTGNKLRGVNLDRLKQLEARGAKARSYASLARARRP